MTARLLILPMAFVVLFALAWSPPREAQPAPVPWQKAVEKVKPWSELLIGTWKRVEFKIDGVEIKVSGDSTVTFTRDGKCSGRYFHPRIGVEEYSGEYWLAGNVLMVPGGGVKYEHREIRENTFTIESLTENQLVELVITRKRHNLEWAQKLAIIKEVPLDQVLAEVIEERQRTVYARINGE